MENVQMRNPVYANKSNQAYNKKTSAKDTKDAEEKTLSYKEELRKAREEKDAADAAKKKLQREKQPISPESVTLAKKTSQEMLEILSMFSEAPNIPTNLTNT